MNSKTITIKQLIRNPQYDNGDELHFDLGVNLIAGGPNTGKTKWLAMLDYILGDDSQPETALGTDIAHKYDSVAALCTVCGEELFIERRWKQRGIKGKILVDGEPLAHDEFSDFLLEKLGIPLLQFPKGSPYTERKWPRLSWRMLLRHIYRQQRFWSSFADEQPESELQACLLQFLGLAKYLYSDLQGELVRVRKEIWKEQGAKDSFISMLDRISHDVIAEKETQVTLTALSIESAIHRLADELNECRRRREVSLSDLQKEAVIRRGSTDETTPESEFEQLSQLWVDLQMQKEKTLDICQ